MRFVSTSFRTRNAPGFSLIELLIGVVIGLVGLLAIFQVVTVWDSHNRTTTAGSDADVGGTLAMFSLERDIKQAGLGMRPPPVPYPASNGWQYTCNNVDIEVNDTAGAAGSLRFHPVEIITGAAGAPDAINVFYGDTSFMPAPEPFSLSTPTTKTITPNRYGFKPGDLAIVTGSSSSQPCALVEITAGADSGGLVTHAPGNYAPFYPGASASSVAARFNGSAGTTATYTTGNLYNLGPVPQFNAWSISATGVLRRTELIFNSTSPVDVSEGVINMKAQYGIDGLTAAPDQIIGTDEWTANPPAAGTWNNVLAVRVAILVRSKQWERSATGSASGVATGVTLTAPQPSWATCAVPATCGGFAMTNVDGTPDSGPGVADANNWRFYRYRVYEKVIPLRNMIWG